LINSYVVPIVGPFLDDGLNMRGGNSETLKGLPSLITLMYVFMSVCFLKKSFFFPLCLWPQVNPVRPTNNIFGMYAQYRKRFFIFFMIWGHFLTILSPTPTVGPISRNPFKRLTKICGKRLLCDLRPERSSAARRCACWSNFHFHVDTL